MKTYCGFLRPLMILHCLVALAVFLLGMEAPATAGIEAAVVRIGGCTGVCVHPRGLVLTVKHCGHRAEETILFERGTYSARRIYASTELEGPVVFDCGGTGLPWVPVAANIPAAGSRVFSIGWPADARGQSQRQRAEGRLLRGQCLVFEGRPLSTNAVDFGTAPGWSGGPLFNAAGEVIGLLHGTDGRESYFLTFAATQAAYNAASSLVESASPPKLLVFTTDECAACQTFHRDYRQDAAFRARFNETFRVLPVDPHAEREMARQYAVRTVPTFVTPGRPPIVGYRGRDWLMTQLFGEEAAALDPPEAGKPAEDEFLDAGPMVGWSHVSIVVLAAKQPVSELRGQVRGWAVESIGGLLRRRIAEATDGRAALTLLAERTEPARFEAVCRAAGAIVERFYVLVLVREQPLGLKGLIAAPLETLAAERLAGAPVDLIFDRAHAEDFVAVQTALQSSRPGDLESQLPAQDEPEFPAGETALGGLLAILTERVRPLRRLVGFWQRRRG